MLCRLDAALMVDVAPAHLDRVDAESVRQPGHHALGCELGLRSTKAPERTTGDIIRVDHIAIRRDVGHFVAACREEGRYLEHLYAGRSISASIGNYLCLHRNYPSVIHRPPVALDRHRVALVMSHHRLFTAPDHRGRPLQLPGG